MVEFVMILYPILVVALGLTLFFAQLKMFSIDSTLKKILKILEDKEKS